MLFMTELRMMSSRFDVFLIYNRRDRSTIQTIAAAIEGRGLRVWLDEWELVPGRPWQKALEDAIRDAQAAAVLIGEDGLDPWGEPQMRACLEQWRRRNAPVIPVLLPGAAPELSLFLAQHMWVDLRDGIAAEGLDRLVWGITGEKPTAAEPVDGEALSTSENYADADAAYCAWAGEQHRSVSLIGVGGGDIQLRLSEVFVPLVISQRAFAADLEAPAELRLGPTALAHGVADVTSDEIFITTGAYGLAWRRRQR